MMVAMVARAQAEALTLSGHVTDGAGQPVPYASVFVRETLTGTATDEAGAFTLTMPADTAYHVVAQSVGYQMKEQRIAGTGIKQLHITLQRNEIMLGEVTAHGGEDPAYGIMRQVIVRAPLHLHSIERYTAKCYVKAAVRFTHIPSLVAARLGNKAPEPWRTYTAESFNTLQFEQPDVYRHTILQEQHSPLSDVLGSDKRHLRYFNINLYDVDHYDLLISPLSPRAFASYKFVYEGSSQQGGRTINHVRVIPRSHSKQLFAGVLHICEGSWQVVYANLDVRTPIGHVNVEQTFIEVSADSWLPVVQKYALNISLLGIKGKATYVGVLNYTDVVYADLAKQYLAADTAQAQQMKGKYTRTARRISGIMERDELRNRNLRRNDRLWRRNGRLWHRQALEADSTKKRLEVPNPHRYVFVDSTVTNETQWHYLRPIELTPDEAEGFAIALNPDEDTLDTRQSRTSRKIAMTIFGQQSIALNDAMSLRLSGLNTNMMWYNPATGFCLEQSADLEVRQQDINFDVSARVAYAVTTGQIMRECGLQASMKGFDLGLKMGKWAADWKGQKGDMPLTNTFSSLMFKRNCKILMQRDYVELTCKTDKYWPLHAEAAVCVEDVRPRSRVTDFSFFKRGHTFGINLPSNDLIDPDRHLRGRQASVRLSATFTPRLRYYLDDEGQRQAVGSPWPQVTVGIEQGLASMLGSQSQYTHLSFGAKTNKDFTLKRQITWEGGGGVLLNADDALFSSWQHFSGSDKFFALADMANGYKGFVSFAPYQMSCNTWYTYAGAHYQTQQLIIKRIPPLSRWLYTEELFVRSAYSGKTLFTEAGYGVGHIFLIMRATAFVSFVNDSFNSVNVRMALSLGDLLKKV